MSFYDHARNLYARRLLENVLWMEQEKRFSNST
jgi:hypothetical protein